MEISAKQTLHRLEMMLHLCDSYSEILYRWLPIPEGVRRE